MHSVRLELTKLILTGSRTTYQATGDAGVQQYNNSNNNDNNNNNNNNDNNSNNNNNNNSICIYTSCPQIQGRLLLLYHWELLSVASVRVVIDLLQLLPFTPTCSQMCTGLWTRHAFLSGFDGCLLLRGTVLVVNRTHGTHKRQYISILLLTKFGPIYCGPPW